MNWQKACLKSKDKIAIRIDSKTCRIMKRFEDGTGLISLGRNKGVFREAYPSEIDGYLDWEALKKE